MKSGIAPQIAGEWPEVLRVDRLTQRGDINKMGHVSVAKVPDGTIFNIYGQFHWNRRSVYYGTNYDALESGLTRAREYLLSREIKTLGLPRIGCGLAGGQWPLAESIINKVFGDYNIEVFVYELEK